MNGRSCQSGGAATKDFGSAVYNPALYRTAAFFQDRWKASDSLTLTLGLRYEYFGTPFNTLRTSAYTGLFNVDPATRLGDKTNCGVVVKGSSNVFINGKPMARTGDNTSC